MLKASTGRAARKVSSAARSVGGVGGVSSGAFGVFLLDGCGVGVQEPLFGRLVDELLNQGSFDWFRAALGEKP
ncbi:hypothetical protein [Streptomyces hygroscopicus]|uniref:hypothetical protein n=1 Tax=Streptomyces hygroscopicus TaxID=1912 RepID=UPI0036BF4E37